MSGSFFTLNQKYNSLLALINGFFPFPPSPYPPPGDVMTLSTAQTATALKTFSVLPQSSVVPLANDDLTNKLYVDSQIGSVPDIDAVLGNGDVATGKQMLLNDAVGTNFTLYTPSEIQASDGVNDTVFFQPTQLQYTDITGTVSASWLDIISGSASSNTLQEVLTAGNTADLGFSLVLVGANTSNIINNISGTTSSVSVGHIDTGAGTTATSTITSQLNQTDYSASVNDATNGLLGTKTLITIGGSVLDTDTATSTTGAVGLMNRTTSTTGANTIQQLVTGTGITTGYTANVGGSEAETELTFLSPTFDIKYNASSASGGSAMSATSLEIGTGLNCLRTESTAYLALNDLHLSNSDTSASPARQVSYSTQLNQTNALVAQNYNDTTLGIVNSLSQFANATTSEDIVQYSDNQYTTSAKINAEAGVARKVISATALTGGANSTQAESVTNNGYNNVIQSNSATVPTLIATKTEQISAGVQCASLMTYTDQTNNIVTNTQTTMNSTSGSAFYGASNTLAGSSHILKLDVPVSGDALIEHTVVGPNRNLNMTTTGNFLMTSDNLNITASQISSISAGAGGLANPQLLLTNSNATINTIPTIELNKTGRNLTAGESVGSISMYGLDATAQKTEFARIQVKTENVAGGNEDGTLSIFNSVNGVICETFNFNGGQNENNSFRPLDMNGNALRTTSGNLSIETTGSSGTGTITIAPNAGASILIPFETDPTDYIRINPQYSANAQEILMTANNGAGFTNTINLLNTPNRPFVELKADFGGAINKSIQIDADGSGANANKINAYDGQNNLPFQIDASTYTNGSIDLKVNDTTGSLLLTGTALQSGTANSPNGYLRIKINGTYYKIQLLDD